MGGGDMKVIQDNVSEFGWGGVEGWGENADSCNWITIKKELEAKKKFFFLIWIQNNE